MSNFWLRPFTAGGNKASNGLPPAFLPLVLNPSACAPLPLCPPPLPLPPLPEAFSSSPSLEPPARKSPAAPLPQPRATDQSHDVTLPYERIKKGGPTVHKSFKVGHAV